MTTTPKCQDEIALTLSGRDLWVIRLGLKVLLAESTRHEHVYHDIHGALARIPEAHEPHGDECDCFSAEEFGRMSRREAEPAGPSRQGTAKDAQR